MSTTSATFADELGLDAARRRFQTARAELREAERNLRLVSASTSTPPPARPEVQRIQRIVADYHRLSLELLWSRDRSGHLSLARSQAMALCRQITRLGVVEVAAAFYRTHGSVTYAEQTIADRCATEPAFRREYETIAQRCGVPS